MAKIKKYDPVRTSRISDAVWNKARERAREDSVSMSRMISLLVQGYGERAISLPTVKLVFEEEK